MCFAIGTQQLWCCGSQPKLDSNPTKFYIYIYIYIYNLNNKTLCFVILAFFFLKGRSIHRSDLMYNNIQCCIAAFQGNSTQRSDFTGEDHQLQAGNTRFGLSQKPWVDKAWQAEGVAPVVTGGADMHHSRTLTSTQDSYRAPFAPMDKTSTRAGMISQGGAAVLTSADENNILASVSPQAQVRTCDLRPAAPSGMYSGMQAQHGDATLAPRLPTMAADARGALGLYR